MVTRIEIDDVQLAYDDQGQGPPLVMIHGFSGNRHYWLDPLPALRRRHRVIALDLKGFGESDKPFGSDYGLHEQARLVGAFVDRLHLQGLTLFGHSMGGGIALLAALEAAATGSRAISRLILMSSVCYAQRVPSFLRLARLPVLGTVGAALIPGRLQIAAVIPQLYHDPATISPQMVDILSRPLATLAGRLALVKSARGLIPPDLDQLVGRYPTIPYPTLILWGRDDQITPLEVGQRLHQSLPESTLRIIDNCGHMPHDERLPNVLEALADFLKWPQGGGWNEHRELWNVGVRS